MDPSNVDVSKKLVSVEKVRQMIEEADDYFDVGDFVSAESLYSSAIEVRFCLLALVIIRCVNIQV